MLIKTTTLLLIILLSNVTWANSTFIEPEMVEIPAGVFMMGHDKWGSKSNKPAHKVTINKFAIAKYEVTNKEFLTFIEDTNYILVMEKSPRKNENGEIINCIELTHIDKKPNLRGFNLDRKTAPSFEPAVCIAHADARAYVKWLAEKTNKSYRLPSETEWEYAARAGTNTRFFYGNNMHQACEYGNVDDVNRNKHHNCDDGYKDYSVVGSFKANPWGLYDVIGNADEFVADCEHPNGYQGAPSNQKAWNYECASPGRGSTMYIRRGGAAMLPIRHLTQRSHMGDNFGTVHAGFRLAMDLPQGQACTNNKGLCKVNQVTLTFRKNLQKRQQLAEQKKEDSLKVKKQVTTQRK